MLNAFWWGHNSANSRGLHWLSWERLSVPKTFGGMGFKNLRAFNLAMIGKQTWKMVTNPDALITRLLKARYYPHSDFFSASIGHNPSYVWRSLWNTRDFIKCRLKWSIGTGETISVWNEPWLKEPICLQPSTEVQFMWDALTVAHLFKPNQKLWNEKFIHYVFDDGTTNKILQTPLLPSVRADAAVWRHEINGLYSVRSAYRDICNHHDTMLHHRVPRHWNTIWNLKLPPKIKNFLWRICRNCLLTRVRLIAKGIDCPNICAVCMEKDEDEKHLFFECDKSIVCWQRFNLWNSIYHCWSPNVSCHELIFAILQQLDIPQQQIFAVTLWSIWKQRNNRVWNDVVETTQQVSERAEAFLNSWKSVQRIKTNNHVNTVHHDATRWTKPALGRFKCNVDATFSNSLNRVGLGACIRDADGNFVAGRTSFLSPLHDVEMGEALGLLQAMQWAKELNMVSMDFETDSKIVADSIYKGVGASNFMAIIQDCRHLLATDLVNSDVSFIRRQANDVAPSLAREALSHASFIRKTYFGHFHD